MIDTRVVIEHVMVELIDCSLIRAARVQAFLYTTQANRARSCIWVYTERSPCIMRKALRALLRDDDDDDAARLVCYIYTYCVYTRAVSA